MNRVDFETGKGLTAADNSIRATLNELMDGQLAQNGYFLSEGRGKLTGTSRTRCS